MNENNPKQSKIRQKYSPQFKDQAVERALKDGTHEYPTTLGFLNLCFITGEPRKIKAEYH